MHSGSAQYSLAITAEDVQEALELVVSGAAPLPVDNRLRSLLLVDHFLTDPALPPIKDAREYAVFEILVHLIEVSYTEAARVSGLSVERPTAKHQALVRIIQDMQQNAPALQQWSLLYHIYGRTDLNISTADYVSAANVADRTFRRQRERAIKRLVKQLTRQEHQIRQQMRQWRLSTQFPYTIRGKFLGQEIAFRHVRALWEENSRLRVLISGAKGVGKTAFVQAFLHQCVEGVVQGLVLDQIIWIQRPLSLDIIRQNIDAACCVENVALTPTDYFALYQVVIVIDDLTHLGEQSDALDRYLLSLRGCALFLTHDTIMSLTSLDAYLELSELQGQAFHDYVLTEAGRYAPVSDEIDEETLLHLTYQTAGGNPFAINLYLNRLFRGTTNTTHSLHFPETLIGDRTEAQWLALFAMLLLPPQPVEVSVLLDLFPNVVTPKTLAPLIEEQILDRVSVLPERCQLLNMFRTIVTQQLLQRNDRAVVLTKLVGLIDANLSLHPMSIVGAICHMMKLEWLEPYLSPSQFREWCIRLHDLSIDKRSVEWYAILEKVNALLPDDRIDLARAEVHRLLCRWDEALILLRKITERAGRAGGFLTQAEALYETSLVLSRNANYEKALFLARQAFEIAVRFQDWELRIRAQLQLAQLSLEMRAPGSALELLNGLHMHKEAALLRAEAYLLDERWEEARDLTESTIRTTTDPKYLGRLHNLLGRCYLSGGAPAEAKQHFQIAIRYFEDTQDLFALGRSYANLAAALIHLKHFDEAHQQLSEAEALQTHLQDRVGQTLTQHNRSILMRWELENNRPAS
jgi:tetratricopeptide (TPR) repeat protein